MKNANYDFEELSEVKNEKYVSATELIKEFMPLAVI